MKYRGKEVKKEENKSVRFLFFSPPLPLAMRHSQTEEEIQDDRFLDNKLFISISIRYGKKKIVLRAYKRRR